MDNIKKIIIVLGICIIIVAIALIVLIGQLGKNGWRYRRKKRRRVFRRG